MRTGENIYYRKDGRWEGRVKQGWDNSGKRKYCYLYGKTYSEVKQKMVMVNAVNVKKDILFKFLVKDWLYKKKYEVKESTYALYELIIKRYILPYLGELKISQINCVRIQNFISFNLKRKQKANEAQLSGKTIRDIAIILKSIFKLAEIIYEIKNPMQEIKLPRAELKEINVLQPLEIEKIITISMQKNDLCSLGIILCLYTGIRLGELCALKWKNICFITKTIKIDKTMQRIYNYDSDAKKKTKIIIDTPKSKKSLRTIPLPDFLCVKLQEVGGNMKKEAYLLTGMTNKFIEPRNYQNYFKRYLKELGLRNVNFHILRHTFATRCIEVGVDIKSLSEILGHTNINITLNRYVHSSLEYRRRQIEKLTFINSH